MDDKSKGISLFALVALVVSTSIGSGIFALSTDLAGAASPGAAIIAWLIVGAGFTCLAMVLANLIEVKPQVEGVFAYADEGFGTFAGFISGWGYWLSGWLGNVAFATVLMSAVGFFIPTFGNGQNIISIFVASIVMWCLTLIVIKGIESAAFINGIVMVCKLIPLFTFIVVAMVLFDGSIFTADFWGTLEANVSSDGGAGIGSVGSQILNCTMVMMWVFVGIEGASNLTARAKRKNDVSKATLIGIGMLLVVYILASVLPYGFMSRAELAALPYPSMVYIFNSMVGPWGGAFVSIGMIVSILGSWLSFTILPAETAQLMAERDMLPKIFGKLNKNGSPQFSLILVAVMAQIFIISLLVTENAYNLAFSLCSSAIVITWTFAAAYQVKYSLTEGKGQKGNTQYLIQGSIAVVFLVLAIVLGGLDYLLLCFAGYLPGVIFYSLARRNAGRKEWLTKAELVVLIVFILGAAFVINKLATGVLVL